MKKSQWQRMVPFAITAALVWGAFAPLGTVSAAQADNAPAAKTWNFAKDAQGWQYAGKYGYKGKPVVAYDQKVGKGAIKVDVDFSKVADSGWSEVKLANSAVKAEAPLDIKGYNKVSYDFYYNPANMTKGSFKTKLFLKLPNNTDISAWPDIDLKQAKDAGNGLKMVHVEIPFNAAPVKIVDFEVNLVGSNTDYKGSLYVDNITMSYDDGYVVRTVKPERQAKLTNGDLQIPQEVALTDKAATPNTARLYAYLDAVANSPYVMYGHQNDRLMKAGKGGSSDSDTKDMLGDYPGVIEIDAMTLVGGNTEYQNHEPAPGAPPAVYGKDAVARGVTVTEKAFKDGSICALSAHMPNFDLVQKKGKNAAGQYDYTGFTSVVTTGDIVPRVMPGGDLNELYRGYLDVIADYALQLQAKDIPVLFRPFHENNGSWFWWGAAHCSASQFKNLFRYTEEYLRDVRGVHNFLYVYSPNGPIASAAEYETRYPGDAFIDIPGFDVYQENPQKKDTWMDALGSSLDVVQGFAEKHGKFTTVPESGILCGKDTLGRTGAQRKEWYSEVLGVLSQRKAAYFLSWSDFNADVFDEPYMADKKRGHEMVDGFTRFYNNPKSVFAKQNLDYTKLKVQAKGVTDSYGYLTSPNSNDRVTAPQTVKAQVKGATNGVQFSFCNDSGQVIAKVAGKVVGAGIWSAPLTQEVLDGLGETAGTVVLESGGKVMDSLRVFYNMPQTKAPIEQVDDYESYYGDNELLAGAYSTNCGPGCSIHPKVTTAADEHAGGNYGLGFHYTLVKGGWAGIVKSMNGTDWSAYDAVQFWFKPDGKGQKFIVQINTNGEDFEVDLTKLAQTTQAQLVTIPFADFVGKQNGTFDKSHIQHFAFYCNTVGDDAVDSTFYMDDAKAVKQ